MNLQISSNAKLNEKLKNIPGADPGADPGFQVRGGGALKKIALSGGGCEHFWGISCEKSRFYAKKILFFPILGCARRVRPPGSPLLSKQFQNQIENEYL